MRNRIVFCALLFTLIVTETAQAQSAIGFFAGFNRASLSGDAPKSTSYAPYGGFGAGFVGEVTIAKDVRLSLQPMFLQKGSKIAYNIRREKDPRDSLAVRLDYISLPILFKIISGNRKTYVTGGLDFGFLMNAKLSNLNEDQGEIDIKDFFQSVDMAANFAFGAMFPIGRPLLTFELRYQQSILNIANPDKNPEEQSLPRRFRSSGFQFYAGLLVPFGKK